MGRWQDLIRGWSERRLGFRMQETMRGTHRLRGDAATAERPFELSVSWGHRELGRFLNPLGGEFLIAELAGTVTAEGLCERAPLSGSLELRYVPDALLRYRFEFDAGAGGGPRRCRYLGEKRGLRPWNLHRTHTICYGEISDVATGEVISDSVVRFDLRELPAFLASLRLD